MRQDALLIALLRRPLPRIASHAAWLCAAAPPSAGGTTLEALRACGRRGRWKPALELLAKLEASGDDVPVSAWHSALLACRKKERKREVLQLLERMPVADTQAYNEVLHTYRLKNDYEGAAAVWRRLRPAEGSIVARSDAVPDGVSYYHLMHICGETGRWEEAARLLRELEESGTPTTPGHWLAALRACARDRRWAEAAALARRTPPRVLESEPWVA